MNKYYVVETSVTSTGQANAVTVKDTFAEAQMLYHQTRASALANEGVTYSMCAVLDCYGNVLLREHNSREA